MKKFAAGAGLALSLVPGAAMADVIYNSIPAPLPPNLPSLGYQATQTSEFGDRIQFAGTARNLTTVTVTLSDWAKYSDWSGAGYSSTGFSVPMTLNIYSPGSGNSVGSLLSSVTAVQNILWRPEADAACGTGFLSGGTCYSGLAQNVIFDFTGTVVPDEIIFGLVFNTQSWGPKPLGVDGPYNSLNFALNDTSGPSVGTDVDADSLYWNTATVGNYSLYDPTATAFQRDTNWRPYVPSVRFDAVAAAVPEPGTVALFGVALLGLGLYAARRRKAGAAI